MSKIENLINGFFPGPMLQKKRRIIVGVLAVVSAVLIFLSFFLPYWHFTLIAPQYPEGLHVKVYLNHLEGDVRELDILNHYIGMKKMEDAAEFERKIAFWAVTLISLSTIAFLYSKKNLGVLLALPSVVFPVAFILELFIWLYRYGHELNPHAPIKISPFTPKIFGVGKIAQFETHATFGIGFYLLVVAALLVVLAVILRVSVCNSCPIKGKCGVLCAYSFKWRSTPDDFARAGMLEKAKLAETELSKKVGK